MAKLLTPHPHQQEIIDIMLERSRANIFASPGTGKTASALYALDIRRLLGDDVFPVLVAAPLRVANTVWSTEIEGWLNFQDFTYVKVLGNVKKRTEALNTKADFYFINTENLVWLEDFLLRHRRKWPFKTVIVDESTRIKNHRCSRVDTRLRKDASRFKTRFMFTRGGSKGPSALMKHAHGTPYWYNLTGTPTPNGVKDLWGQQWPIDFGAALGSTFTEFKERWFVPEWGSSVNQERIKEIPGAREEILDLIAPNTVTVDSATMVDEPNIVNLLTEMSDTQKADYKKLVKEAYLEMIQSMEGKETVTAVNAGALSMKMRQFASGAIINDQKGITQIHNLKVEAVKELTETLGDQPIIVAYHFRSDLAALTKAFPKAVVLPTGNKQKEVEDAWNAGKIKMLLLHPQSAGHGLNLQYGGNIMVLYTPDWNAEYYEQVIERIGPMRQKQAGFDRPVWIYRIVTKGTIDTVVLGALDGKITVSQAVKDYLLDQ